MGDEQTIAGRYVRGPQVATDPLATVFSGRAVLSEGFERPVAIKRLSEELSENDLFVSTLGQAAARLMAAAPQRSEGILDIVREDGALYLITDWVDGPSLRQWVEAHHERGEPAPYSLVLAIASQVLFGLHALHTRPSPLVHGAVGPAAIRIDRAGVPVVTRFGIRAALDAAKIDEAWVQGEALRIDAPERRLSPAADVFAVGLTIYTILAGTSDVSALPAELRDRLMAGKPADLSLLRDDVPPVVLRTIERSLRPDPAERFESAAAMARSCELILRTMAEMTDPPAIASSVERVLPRGDGVATVPAKQRAKPRSVSAGPPPAPPPKHRPAPKSRPAGLKAEETDQLDLDELSNLKIDEE